MDCSKHLQAYFNRIGYTGDAKPNIETLKTLHLLHTQSIPFENLNPLLKTPVELDIESIIDKMVYHKRGGYCFEQNILFSNMLQCIGFETKLLAGRVLIDRPEETLSAQTHMLNFIRVDGNDYIADVGFGGNSLTGPLAFEMDITQHTPHEDYRILERKEYYLLQVNIRDEWRNLYRFELDEWHYIDYKLANWYTSTHPDSHFTKSLTAAIVGDKCRYALKNNMFRTHYLHKESEKHEIKSMTELIEILSSVFKIDVPDTIEQATDKIFS